MDKILVVFGTRPEAIKMAPVIQVLRKSFYLSVCVTAQHREMLDQVLDLFEIVVDYDLDIMKSKQDLFDITNNVLQGIKRVILKEDPDLVMVHGDTSTTMSASLAAFYLHTPVAHIEAGLRTYNINSPFPEELNRRMVSLIADYHFAPTDMARENLLKDGVDDESIVVTGNTVIDALFMILKKARTTEFPSALLKKLPFLKNNLNQRIVLITGHRRENFGKRFEEICQALYFLAKSFPDVNFVYPVHLNPNVLEPVSRLLSDINNIYLIEPLDYLPFVKLMDRSYIILTDSGGIQEEAPSLGKPVLVMRDSTERPEAIATGAVKLVGADKENIIQKTSQLLTDESMYKVMKGSCNPYGDGNASEQIKEYLNEK